MMRPLAPLAALVALVACSNDPGFTGVSGIREITAAEAQTCRYIMGIRGTPSVFGPLAQQGLEYTRNRILADAKEAGANAIVFDPVSPGTQVYEVTATAYSC